MTAPASSAAGGGGHGGTVMYFMCEKKSPYTSSWTMRRCAFDSETRYLYYSSKALNFSSPWKKALKITAVKVPAEAEDFKAPKLFVRDNNTDGDRNERNLYLFTVEGVYRNMMAHNGPPTNVMPNATAFQRPRRGWPSKHSPRGDSFQHEKTVVYTLRCDNVTLLHKVIDVMRDVLADDGLCAPINEGLPLQDPRNNIPLAHVPLYLGQPFKGLDKTVFYAFQRGDLVGQGLQGQLGTTISGGFLCLTDKMAIMMRSDGSVPRWAALTSIDAVEYNAKDAKLPFVALLTANPAVPDIVFVPLPPILTSEERRAYNAVQHVESLVALFKRLSVFAQHPMTFTEVPGCASVRMYVEGKASSNRPLRWAPAATTAGESAAEPLAYPLPKAQLAKILAAKRRQELAQQLDGAQAPAPAASAAEPAAPAQPGQANTVTARAAAPSSCAVPSADSAASREEVVLEDPSSADEDLVDDDIDIGSPMAAQPSKNAPAALSTAAGGAPALAPGADDGADEDIVLSDSLEDLDPVDEPRTTTTPSKTGDAGGTTLEQLINQSFAAFPR